MTRFRVSWFIGEMGFKILGLTWGGRL
jgi:hypothetical protein